MTTATAHTILGLSDYVPVPAHVGALGTADDGTSAAARSLLCLTLPAPRLPPRACSARRGGTVDLVLHVAVVTTVMSLAAWSGSRSEPAKTSASHQPLQPPRMVFLQLPGPAGGGGGSGHRQARPPSRAQAIGRDRVTVPVAKPVAVTEKPSDTTPSPEEVVLDAKPLASGTMLLAGLPDVAASLPVSQGPGLGGGVGTGTGSGVGSGTGAGVGTGSGGGFGGGVYRVGNGVVPPTLLKEVKPRYTPEALQRRIEGPVALEVVVGRDGIPIAIRVTRSLDPEGLDQAAVAAVHEWRFTPGRIGETPVDVLVIVLLDFHVR